MQNLIGISGRIGSGKDTLASIIQYLVYRNKKYTYPYTQFISESEIYKVDRSKWEVKKFAAKLKQIVCLLTGCTMEDLESQEFKARELPPEWNGMTYRTMLQKVGTEAMRGQLHDQVWVNSLFADYKNPHERNHTEEEKEEVRRRIGNVVVNFSSKLELTYPKWIISDMRFPNEMEAVKSRGGVTIRINRPKPKVSTGDAIIDNVLNETKNFGIVEHPSETALDNAEFDYVIDNDGTIGDLIGKVEVILRELEII